MNSIQLGAFELESNCSEPCGTGYEVYRAPIVTPAAYGGKECNPFLFPLCNTQACDANIYQNCSFVCNGTDAFFNVSTIQGNASTPEAAGCNITCVTLNPVDCLVGYRDNTMEELRRQHGRLQTLFYIFSRVAAVSWIAMAVVGVRLLVKMDRVETKLHRS